MPITQDELDNILNAVSQIPLVLNKTQISSQVMNENIAIISVEGEELDFTEGSNVVMSLCRKLLEVECHLIFELTTIPYISSMGIGNLANLASKLIAKGYKICIIGVHQYFKELFESTNFNKVIHLCSSVEEAVNELSK